MTGEEAPLQEVPARKNEDAGPDVVVAKGKPKEEEKPKNAEKAGDEKDALLNQSKRPATNKDALPKRKEGLNARLGFAIFSGAFGSAFQHGYNTGVVNAPQALIMDWLQNCPQPDNLTGVLDDEDCEMGKAKVTLIWSWIVAIFCVGGMIGGAVVGIVSSRLGRKGGLLANNILMLAAGICMFAAKYLNTFVLLVIGRLLVGINSGLAAGLSPMYLSEISPTSLRGAVGTVYQLIITISILLSQILGMSSVLGTENGWPFLFGLTIIPGIIQVFTLPFCPESPKFLLLDRDDEERSTSALTWLRGRVDVHDEMDEMRAERESIKHVPKVTLSEMLKNSNLRQPLTIAVMMMLAQQLSGINCAIFYSTSIFKSGGLNETMSQYATLGMGVMNVLMTFVSLALIEKAGRKTLMVTGLSIMFATTLFLFICLLAAKSVPILSYVSIVMVIGFVVGFATGPGSIPWFFVTELFNQSGRPLATSIAVMVNWLANFFVGLGFSPLQLAIGPYVFVIFIVIQLFFIAYVALKVPETKNKTVEEITAQFRQNN